jgi:hypothetical protein
VAILVGSGATVVVEAQGVVLVANMVAMVGVPPEVPEAATKVAMVAMECSRPTPK